MSVAGITAIFEMDSLRLRPSAESCLVDLAYPSRDEFTPLISLLGAPVSVGARAHRFEFDAALLDRPVVRKPAELDGFVDGLPCRLWGEADEAPLLHRQIRASLDAALIVGDLMSDLATLAHRLHLSEATLRRRLRVEGVNFRQLREDCVRGMARHHLEQTDWDIETIALRLGFYDGGAFRRAFRRWYGCAPRDAWRGSLG